MSAPRASKLGLLAACAVTLGGCSNTRAVGADHVLHVAINEYRLNPASARVSAGVLTIEIHNYGRLAHNLVVSENGQTTGSTKPLFPGQSAELSLNLAPGTYQLTSSILNDQALGAYGTLRVTG